MIYLNIIINMDDTIAEMKHELLIIINNIVGRWKNNYTFTTAFKQQLPAVLRRNRALIKSKLESGLSHMLSSTPV